MATKLLDECRKGFDAPEGSHNPYYSSSNSGMAWDVGAWLRRTGRSEPFFCTQGRGYQINVNDMKCAWRNGEVSRIS